MAQDVEAKAAEEAQNAYAAAAEAKLVEPSVPATPVAAAQPVASKPEAEKPKAEKPARKAAAAQAKPAPRRKPVNRKRATPTKIATPAAKSRPVNPLHSIEELKEKIMSTAKKTNPEISKLLETAQAKAQEVYAKSAAAAGEVSAFSKGNVEAIVESGKILGAGVQALGKDYVAESKSVIDTFTADLKALAAVKSPTELFQLQGKLARRNFDNAVAYGSKTSESLVKLANEVLAPISNRVSVAVDKVSKAA
jgi:phasin family protein